MIFPRRDYTLGVLQLASFRHVLLDLDGTIAADHDPLPGAVELISRLSRDGRSFAILSNAGSSPDSAKKRLAKMGIAVPADRIFTAARAAVQYILQTYGPRPRVFDLATESAHAMLEGRARFVTSIEEPCDVVFHGAPANVYCTPERQRMALELLRRGAKLVSLCADRVYPSARGIEFGSGAMSAMLSYASGVKPVFCGKPERLFFMELCEALQMRPAECVLIGDNLESDIAGAKNAGMATILTLTGVTRASDVDFTTIKPDRMIQDLFELL